MPKTKSQTATAGESAAESVGIRLRELRTQRQFSQGDIEKRTGLLRCYVSRVEGGYTVPSVETLEKFAAALAVPVHAIFQHGKAAEVRPISKAKARTHTAPDPYSAKLRRLVSKMDDRDRDTFLSLVRKLAILES
jgi:transcriptional regulator with XRE-family HTH domain